MLTREQRQTGSVPCHRRGAQTIYTPPEQNAQGMRFTNVFARLPLHYINTGDAARSGSLQRLAAFALLQQVRVAFSAHRVLLRRARTRVTITPEPRGSSPKVLTDTSSSRNLGGRRNALVTSACCRPRSQEQPTMDCFLVIVHS